eukprot:3113321-Amphidinium_carterae.2
MCTSKASQRGQFPMLLDVRHAMCLLHREGVGCMGFKAWWGRLGGLSGRLTLHLGVLEWLFLFVDDFLALVRPQQAELAASLCLVFWTALGLPLSWHKVALSYQLQWIGIQFDFALRQVSIAAHKIPPAVEFLERIADGNCVSAATAIQGVSKLRWVVSTAPGLTAFLQPLHTLAAALSRGSDKHQAGRPSHLARAAARFLIHMLREPPVQMVEFFHKDQGMGGCDAKATATEAFIGGWWCPQAATPVDKATCHWFSLQLCHEQFPQLFIVDDLKKLIATFELLACAMLVHMAIEVCGAKGQHMALRFKGINDNQGVVFALLKQYSAITRGKCRWLQCTWS